MKAIETSYKGYRFRSRLEARWAVFLDALRIPWEYEKQGFDLDGVRYLPDFWLPQQRQWMEVKGERSRDGWQQAYLLAKHTGQFVAIVYGELSAWSPGDPHWPYGYGWYGDDGGTWPDDPDPVAWGECPVCGTLGIGLYGHHEICTCHATNPVNERPIPVSPDRAPPILNAYRAARSVRFEHGESPRV